MGIEQEVEAIAPTFFTVPPQLTTEVPTTTYLTHCGLVKVAAGDSVVVGLFRHVQPKETVPYLPPSLDYLEKVIFPKTDWFGRAGHRVPHNNAEHYALLNALATV